MSTTGQPLHQVLATLEQLWPPAEAEHWDAVGLVTGDPSHEVRSILLVVDVVDQTVQEACDLGADLIVAHHPLLLRGVTSVAEDHYKGRLVATLIRSGVALYSAHTNADAAEGGTSDSLGRALGLGDMSTITGQAGDTVGIGRVGRLAEPMALYDLASALGQILPQTAGGIRVSGEPDQMVQSVALCTGAGDSLLGHPQVRSADVYITADLRHHPASEAQQQRRSVGGPALIDLSHFASEWFFLDGVADTLRAELPGVTVTVSEIVTDPWDFVVLPG